MIDLTMVEIMRRNMLYFCKHFINHETMTKDEFFEIQKEVLNEMKKEKLK